MDKLRRFVAGMLLVNGTLVVLAALAVTLPLWGSIGLLAFLLGVVLSVVFARPEKPPTIRSSSAYGPAEMAGAMAEVREVPSIECVDCGKAIGREEWPAHVNWHRLAEGPPPAAQA